MGTKVFLERKGLALVSDERDVMVSSSLIKDVIAWCDENSIDAEQVATSPTTQYSFGVNLWRVRNDEQRMWFMLRWSS